MERPAILFINTDQLRPDFLGCYGFGPDTSPNIDRLAGEGMVFRNTF
ncbi:MAG TPA: sulfatase-like hydrolase/transferase, partial [Phycisphaerae bacterium]|nr:sulfatase-like hydrolase/transferase [Phycisphaerae bacterium]